MQKMLTHETEIERKCCKSSLEIIDRKFEDCECILDTDGFRDVCMNKNVLEAALGAWHHFSVWTINTM